MARARGAVGGDQRRSSEARDGQKLAELVEAYARNRGMTRLFVNAAPEAVGYYEKLGWQRFSWDETELSGIASGAVQMTKNLVK